MIFANKNIKNTDLTAVNATTNVAKSIVSSVNSLKLIASMCNNSKLTNGKNNQSSIESDYIKKKKYISLSAFFKS